MEMVPRNSLYFIIDIVGNVNFINVMTKFKSEIKKQKIDNEELIRQKISDFIDLSLAPYRHIKKSFQKFKIHELLTKEVKNGKSI